MFLRSLKLKQVAHEKGIARAHARTLRHIVFLLMRARFIDVKWTVKCPLKHSHFPIKHLLQVGPSSTQQPENRNFGALCLPRFSMSFAEGVQCVSWVPKSKQCPPPPIGPAPESVSQLYCLISALNLLLSLFFFSFSVSSK